MTGKYELPIYGTIEAVSKPIECVEPGKHFSFDGKRLVVYLEESLNQIQLLDLCFDITKKPAEINAVVEGKIHHSGRRIMMHVSCFPGFDKGSIRLGVVAYWTMDDEFSLEDVDGIVFSGLCVDSFCPMRGIRHECDNGRRSLMVTNDLDSVIDLGVADIGGRNVELSCEAYWTYEPLQQIKFISLLRCKLARPNYEHIKRVYIAVASALRFCLGRGNTDFKMALCVETSGGDEAIGEFEVVHGRMYVPDERDALEVGMVHALDVGRYFGRVATAFDSGVFRHSELSQSRDDAAYITLAKIIELTSSFEREFRELYPDGVEHSDETSRSIDEAIAALCGIEQGLSCGAKRLVLRARERVLDDSLKSRIRYVTKVLPTSVMQVAYKGLEVCEDDKSLGSKIATVRNDIAHGNELSHKLSDLRKEYRLLIRLVFAMRLLRLDIPDNDVARLLRCMG